MSTEQNWTSEISPKHSLFDFKFKELWAYRDLILLMVQRDFAASYKQTILGPIWFFINPIITSIMFSIVFGGIAGISTDGMPKMLFYLSGVTLWNYFQESLNKTATVFKENAPIFGKVYFPRLIMPLAVVIGNLIKLGLQLILFLIFYFYYMAIGTDVQPQGVIVLLPLLILLMAGLALGMGMVISALTTKYRDMIFLLSFGISLFMYITPVIYSMDTIPEKYKLLVFLNPVSHIVETFRYSFLGTGQLNWGGLLYSTIFTIVILFLGIVVFNKVERNFMDTV